MYKWAQGIYHTKTMKVASRNLSLIFLLVFVLVIPLSASASAFVEAGQYSSYNPAGFFSGVWHGLLAPYTLIVRLVSNIEMYAIPNTGWFYDAGFLVGIAGSLPVGWIAALISIIAMFFT